MAKAFGGLKWIPEIEEVFAGRLYHTDYTTDLVYELDINTFSSISSAGTADNTPYGVGGISDRMYMVKATSGLWTEIDLDTKLQINSASGTGNLRGIGGVESDRVYAADSLNDKSYELDKDTLVIVNNVQSVALADHNGIGGYKDRLYLDTSNIDDLHELDLNTLLPLNTVENFDVTSGIGGISTKLCGCDSGGNTFMELDPDTLITISSQSAISTNPYGVGGTKTVGNSLGNNLKIQKASFNGNEFTLAEPLLETKPQ